MQIAADPVRQAARADVVSDEFLKTLAEDGCQSNGPCFCSVVCKDKKLNMSGYRFATNLFAMFANIKGCKTYLAYCFYIELN